MRERRAENGEQGTGSGERGARDLGVSTADPPLGCEPGETGLLGEIETLLPALGYPLP